MAPRGRGRSRARRAPSPSAAPRRAARCAGRTRRSRRARRTAGRHRRRRAPQARPRSRSSAPAYVTSCSSVPSASRNEPVAWRASSATASGRHRDRLDLGDPPHDRRELLDRRAGEVEAVAAVDDRRQDLRRLGRREHEDRVRRRLLERLEERVPRLGREHVRLVEDVDLVAPGHRRVDDALAQVADVVDGVVGRRVHLDDVERGRARDRHARVAHAAGRDRRPPRSQFRQAARIFAIDVLPVPREPTKR